MMQKFAAGAGLFYVKESGSSSSLLVCEGKNTVCLPPTTFWKSFRKVTPFSNYGPILHWDSITFHLSHQPPLQGMSHFLCSKSNTFPLKSDNFNQGFFVHVSGYLRRAKVRFFELGKFQTELDHLLRSVRPFFGFRLNIQYFFVKKLSQTKYDLSQAKKF